MLQLLPSSCKPMIYHTRWPSSAIKVNSYFHKLIWVSLITTLLHLSLNLKPFLHRFNHTLELILEPRLLSTFQTKTSWFLPMVKNTLISASFLLQVSTTVKLILRVFQKWLKPTNLRTFSSIWSIPRLELSVTTIMAGITPQEIWFATLQSSHIRVKVVISGLFITNHSWDKISFREEHQPTLESNSGPQIRKSSNSHMPTKSLSTNATREELMLCSDGKWSRFTWPRSAKRLLLSKT